MSDTLDEMDDHRPPAFRDRNEALDAQEIGTAQRRQNHHRLFKSRPA